MSSVPSCTSEAMPLSSPAAPLFTLLQQQRARVYPNGVAYHANLGTVAEIARILLQPRNTSTSGGSGPLRIGDDELQLLGRHLAGAAKLAQLDFVYCAFTPVAFNCLLQRLTNLQRVAVCACNLDALAFCSLLSALPDAMAALDASGNNLSRLAARSRPRIFRGSRRRDDNSEPDVTGLARLTALAELRLQRSAVSGDAMESIASALQVCCFASYGLTELHERY